MRLLILCALACTLPAAAALSFHAEGRYSFATAVAYFVVDACGNEGTTDGVDSSCLDIPAWITGRPYEVTFTALAGETGGQVCFYDGVQYLDHCGAGPRGTIPAAATRASLTSLGGAEVTWVFEV